MFYGTLLLDFYQQEPKEGVSWTRRWLEVLKREAEKGFHPTLPEYGFGDPSSYRVIESAVQW